MKRKYSFPLLLLCFLSFLASASMAQAWHPFPGGNTYGYVAPLPDVNHRYLFAARVDRVILEGADSAHYFFRIDRPAGLADTVIICNGSQIPSSRCILIDEDHYFGQKMLVNGSGLCRFVFSNADTFVLQSRASVGDSWVFHGAVTAQVDSIRFRHFLGTLDSLKYISLSNGRSLVLSRNHGMQHMINLQAFYLQGGPAIDADFELWGIEELGLGGHLPGMNDIFGFAVGDELGYYQSHFAGSFSTNSRNKLYKIQGIANQNPLQYNAILGKDSLWGLGNPTYYYFPPAPVVLTYYPNAWTHLDLLPYEHSSQVTNSASPWVLLSMQFSTTYPDRIEKTFAHGLNPMLGEYEACADAFLFTIPTTVYRTGQGEVYFHYEEISITNINRGELTCYKQLGDGQPGCELGPVAVAPASAPLAAPALKVFPNPSSGPVTFQLEGMHSARATDLRIYDALGACVRSMAVHVGDGLVEMDLGSLSPGVYVAQLERHGEALHRARFVLVR